MFVYFLMQLPRMEDILNLQVQDPPSAEFSAAHLNWVKVKGGRLGGDDIALIPFARAEDFVKGESSNAECPASFRIESRRKRAEGSIRKPRVDGYLEYTLYVNLLVSLAMFSKKNSKGIFTKFLVLQHLHSLPLKHPLYRIG